MVPLRFSNGTVNTLSFATRDPTGFRSELLDALRELSLPITVLFERFVAEETAASTLSAYLGFSAARHVLGGVVRVGQGRRIEAVVLFGDLHGYTRLSASLSPAETVVLLNDYFDCVVGAIEDRGGHVLKFIGDAFLAVFLIENKSRPICAAATIGAVQEIRRRLARLNKRREEQALPALSHSVAVHFGPVVYGNVGSTTRLDFTVIGQEVNVAARIQEAAKSLNLDYVFTDQYVAAFGDAGLVRHGPYKLNELGREVDLYTLCEEAPLDSVLRYGPYISAV
jgi:adenylate cyclase